MTSGHGSNELFCAVRAEFGGGGVSRLCYEGTKALTLNV